MDLEQKIHLEEVIIRTLGDDTVALNENANQIISLNPTAKFLLENCDGKTGNELIQLFYAQLTDKDELPYQMILDDCNEALDKMLESNFIYLGN